MPLFLVERTFNCENGLGLPGSQDPLKVHLDFTANNARAGVTWIHSYITPDRQRSFCLYEGPSPEAVRQAASLNGLPVDRINEVRSADPYTIQPEII